MVEEEKIDQKPTIRKPPVRTENKVNSERIPGRDRAAKMPTASFRSASGEQGAEFEAKLLDLARVTRVSAGGKRFRFRATVIAGNKMGKVGVGVAKGLDVAQAIDKATRMAKRNIITIPMAEETIPHRVEAKFGAARVLLRPQRKGRGLVAGGVVRVICSLAGIKNVSSKILGRTGNKINNARATIDALKKLK